MARSPVDAQVAARAGAQREPGREVSRKHTPASLRYDMWYLVLHLVCSFFKETTHCLPEWRHQHPHPGGTGCRHRPSPCHPDHCAVWSPWSAPRWLLGARTCHLYALQGNPAHALIGWWFIVEHPDFFPCGTRGLKIFCICSFPFPLLHRSGCKTNAFNSQEFQVIQFPFYGLCFGYLISEQFPCLLEIPGPSPVCISGSFCLLCLRGSL